MTLKNYEKRFALYISIILFFISFLIFISYLTFNKHFCYKNYTGIVSNKSTIVMIKNSEIKYFYQNATLINDAKKKKFTIRKVYKNILKKDKEKYSQIVIDFKLPKKVKDNDVLNISLRKKQERLINIFKIIWKEE